MSSQFVNSGVVCFHTHTDGVTWVGQKSKAPDPFDGDWSILDKYKYVRILGCHTNIPTILDLWGRIQGSKARLQIGSPTFAESFLSSPVDTIYKTRQYVMPAAVGGWHDATIGDIASYAVADGRIPFDQHPLYARLRFLPSLELTRLKYLVTLVLDPRWFAVPHSPLRLTKMEAFFGLNNETLEDVRAKKDTQRVKKYRIVSEAWSTGSQAEINLLSVNSFLHRRARMSDDGIYDLPVAKLFLAFVVWNWRQMLSDYLANPQEIFIPKDLLGCAVSDAFESFMTGVDKCPKTLKF